MNTSLLTSLYSDDFSLGDAEKYLTRNLAERIIRFRIGLNEINCYELAEFLNTYDNIKEKSGLQKIAVAEFLLEKFFEDRKQYFDRVTIYKREPGQTEIIGDYTYNFLNGGKTIFVCDNYTNKMITVIQKLVDIRKDKERQVIICDFRTGTHPERVHISPRIKATKNLLGKGYILSYMQIYPSDTFKNLLSPPENPEQDSQKKSFIETFLDYSDTNLCFVYSANTTDLAKLRQNVSEIISPKP